MGSLKSGGRQAVVVFNGSVVRQWWCSTVVDAAAVEFVGLGVAGGWVS